MTSLDVPSLDTATPIERLFGEGLPIVCFANDWNGDPTSKHHIMRCYAEHTDVLWVESSGMRVPQLGSGHDLRRIAKRLKSAAGGLREGEGRLKVLSPLSLPLPTSRAARALNGVIYRDRVRRAMARMGVRHPPLLWVYAPTVAPYLRGMRRSGLVYHCVDRWWAFTEYDAAAMRGCHEQLCREADVVFASAAGLLEDCRQYTDRAWLMPHGVDWEHFSAPALAGGAKLPQDIADVDGPIIGFFGLIHDWVDQELIASMAARFPSATVVLIGKAQVDVSALRSYANIRLLGQKPYEELARYAAAFDVGIIPFKVNDLTLAVNPIKLREYLSAGIPVVATALPEIAALAQLDGVYPARTHEEHLGAITGLLARPRGLDERRAAAAAMATESWEGRCAEMARIVGEQLR